MNSLRATGFAAILLLIFSGRTCSAEDEGQKLYDAMQQAIAKAKTQRVAFEVDADSKSGVLNCKGTLLLAEGNRLRLDFDGKTSDGKDSKVTFISDGKKLFIQTEISDKKVNTTRDAIDELNEVFVGSMTRASMATALNAIATTAFDHPSRLKPTNFKALGKEKLGDKEVDVIEFQMKTPTAGNHMACKVWLDAKTNLPRKRSLVITRDGKELLHSNESYSDWQLDATLPEDSFVLPK